MPKLTRYVLTQLRQEGKRRSRQIPLVIPTSNAIADPPTVELCAPNVVRRVKSFSEYYNVVRTQMKEELREDKRKRRQRNQFANVVEFESWYGGIQNDLVDASHDEYR
jgi:hypothetical protein